MDLEVLLALMVLLAPKVLQALEDPMALDNPVGLIVLDSQMLQCTQFLQLLLEWKVRGLPQVQMVLGVQLDPEVLLVPVDRFDHLTQADQEVLMAPDLLGIQIVLLAQGVHSILADPDCLSAQVVHLARWDQVTPDFHLDPEVLSILCLRGDLKDRMVLVVLEVQGAQTILVVPDIQRDLRKDRYHQ